MDKIYFIKGEIQEGLNEEYIQNTLYLFIKGNSESITLEEEETNKQNTYYITNFQLKALNQFEKSLMNIDIYNSIKQSIGLNILFEKDLNKFIKIYTYNNNICFIFPKFSEDNNIYRILEIPPQIIQKYLELK